MTYFRNCWNYKHALNILHSTRRIKHHKRHNTLLWTPSFGPKVSLGRYKFSLNFPMELYLLLGQDNCCIIPQSLCAINIGILFDDLCFKFRLIYFIPHPFLQFNWYFCFIMHFLNQACREISCHIFSKLDLWEVNIVLDLYFLFDDLLGMCYLFLHFLSCKASNVLVIFVYFCRFPYFLPCLFISVFALIATVSCFWLPVCFW